MTQRATTTFAADIEKAANEAGEAIISCVIGDLGWGKDDKHAPAHEEPLPWADARPLLDYEYSDGFGGEDCNPIFAWSENWVFAVHQYDGSTSVVRIPRNPVAIKATFDGIYDY